MPMPPAPTVLLTCDICGADFERKDYEERARARRNRGHGNAGTYCSLTCYRSRPADPENKRKNTLAATRRWRRENRLRINTYKRNRHISTTSEAAAYAQFLMHDPCSYCGAPAESIDHIVPLAEGGTNEWDNLTPACRSCNSRKGTQSLLSFMSGFMAAFAPKLPRPLEKRQPWAHRTTPAVVRVIRRTLR